MTRQITPDEAHSIAPDVVADDRPKEIVRSSAVGQPKTPDDLAHEHTPAPPLDHATIRAIVAGIMLAMFLSALEQTIVAPALPAIGKSLGNIDDLSWIVTAYLLAATVTTPLFGKLSDIYGRRTILLVAIGFFIAGSVACAIAPTIWFLIAARGLQGIGGGGLLPTAQTIIADMLSPRERPIVQGRTSIMFMSASILGPVLGGLLTDHLHWSFIFWINLPLGLIALVMTERALRRLPLNHRPHQLDVIGAALMVSAALTLMMARPGAALITDGRRGASSPLSAVLRCCGCCLHCGSSLRASRLFRLRYCTAESRQRLPWRRSSRSAR
jgi:MFS family permease